MSAWAKPGAKCVCVDSDATKLNVGATYTISSVNSDYGCTFLRLVGDKPHDGYYIQRFRPLITRSQEDDVALFRKLLVPEGVDA